MLKKNAKYYLVMFDENFNIFKQPYYSLLHYEKKGTAIAKLEKIIKSKQPKYAVIYDNNLKIPLRYYTDAHISEKFNIPKDYLKLWILFLSGKKEKIAIPVSDEKHTYWHLVNNYVKKKGVRQNIKIAIIYDNKNNILGRFIKNKANKQLEGKGKYHKIKI